jgi:hypothetical protein
VTSLGENPRARLANRFPFLCLKIVFENKNKKPFFVVFSLKKCLANCFRKIVFKNRKQNLRRLDNCFQNSFHLKKNLKPRDKLN